MKRQTFLKYFQIIAVIDLCYQNQKKGKLKTGQIDILKIIIKFNLTMNHLLIYFALIAVTLAVKMKLSLTYEQQKCFYQVLTTQQKYAVQITPLTNGTFTLDINHQQNQQWLHSVTRKTEKSSQNITLYKLASKEALYSFCLINSARENITLRVSFRWGMELLDLQVLAEETDQETLVRQAKWIDKQADKIVQIINNSKNQIASKQQLQNVMSYKLIGFAAFGIMTVVIINIDFFCSIRKTFIERKMI